MANVAVVGAQWGDEGKGKVVDIYGTYADIIVRYQGGNNAGHTLVVNGKKVVLHLIPAAALHENKTCVIANGVVVDVEIFLHELEELKKQGYLKTSKVIVSDRAHVIMPYHKILDQLRERKPGITTIGTTGRGIGPAYADKISRVGIRMGDLLNPAYLKGRLQEVLPEKNCLFTQLYGAEAVSVDALMEKFVSLGEQMRPYIADTNEVIHSALRAKKRVLFEGAQGALLDIDQGTYPFVTSSNTTSGGVTTGAGVSPRSINEIIAITKAYTTRVGTGPFPTELTDAIGDQLQKVGNEFGATTGRRRRCGWLDFVALRHARDLNGFTGLAMTKLDVLSGLDELKVCTAYEYRGQQLDRPPANIEILQEVKPIYKTLKGWKEPLDTVTSPDKMPQALKDYLKFIEDNLEVKVVLLSVGPDRTQTFELRNPFI
jgi:adenylosuccinate synthase